MTRAVTLFVAFALTGMPATLACVMSCDSSVFTTSASECHDHAPVPAERGMGAAMTDCSTPTAEMPFLVQATPLPLSSQTTQPAVLGTLAGPAAGRTDTPGFLKEPADRSLPTHPISTILRI